MQYGFLIDHRRCIGCHACTVARKAENDVPVGDFRTWVKYQEKGRYPAIKRHFAVLRCNHCTSAPCVTICPVNALEKRKDGIVDLDRDACIGCRACMQGCPYDAIYLNEDSGAAEKCHFCAHRVEKGLEPACVIVCPESAIVAGDLHDPQSRIARMVKEHDTLVRRPEQRTGPNVHYLGSEPSTLVPGSAERPSTYLWSDRPPDKPDPWPSSLPLEPDNRVVLDTGHKVEWGWHVAAYLVTKGIAAGAALWAPFVAFMPSASPLGRSYAPELLALLFLLVTNVLLVLDLKRPKQFLSILLRPNTGSWLVKGAWVLIGFGGITTVILAARVLGLDAFADGMRWTNLVGGSLAAAYTAFLFAQCEGRDLWQHTNVLLPHLLVQALCVGGAALLPFVPDGSLAIAVAVMAVLHHALGLLERFGHHDTHNSRMAAILLPAIPVFQGAKMSAFHVGMATTTAASLLGMLLVHGGMAHPVLLALCAVLAWVGLFLYEQAYVRAGQLPPLS